MNETARPTELKLMSLTSGKSRNIRTHAAKIGSQTVALLTFATVGCVAPLWVKFGATNEPESGTRFFYYNPAALQRRGYIVSGKQKVVYENNHDATLATFDIDCRMQRVRFKETRVERHGRVISRDRTGPSEWSEIASGTVANTLADRVCAARSSE